MADLEVFRIDRLFSACEMVGQYIDVVEQRVGASPYDGAHGRAYADALMTVITLAHELADSETVEMLVQPTLDKANEISGHLLLATDMIRDNNKIKATLPGFEYCLRDAFHRAIAISEEKAWLKEINSAMRAETERILFRAEQLSRDASRVDFVTLHSRWEASDKLVDGAAHNQGAIVSAPMASGKILEDMAAKAASVAVPNPRPRRKRARVAGSE